jgi:uncharacterized membrane protein
MFKYNNPDPFKILGDYTKFLLLSVIQFIVILVFVITFFVGVYYIARIQMNKDKITSHVEQLKQKQQQQQQEKCNGKSD